jgi:hypothetical protein
MKWTARTAWRVPRAAARTAALFGMLAVTGLAAGAASASGSQGTATQTATVSLTYLCHFPSRSHPVTVGITASVPTVAKVGKAIRPTGVTLVMALPPAAVPALAGLHATTVSAATRLAVSASEGSVGTSVVWPGATTRPVHRSAHGGLAVTTAGAVPAVTASSPGQVALTAAGLSVTFTPGKAAVPAPGPAASPTPAAGRPAIPAAASATPGAAGQTPAPQPGGPAQRPLQVNCTPVPGQDAILGTVVVTGKPPRAARRHAAVQPNCPPLPPGGLKLNPRFPPPPPPPGATVGSAPAQGCAYTTGYADARKLQGAALLVPALTNVDLFVRTVTSFDPKINYAEFDNAAELDFHGKHEFPPSTATFLTFGFVPTTATILLLEHGTVNIFAIGPAIPQGCKPNQFQNCHTIATVSSRLSVQIVPGSVTVNGTPLNVGSRCETTPFDAILTGSDASNPPYNVVTGGPLTGMVNIPPFHNCGVGENLDPIFNAAISGPQNFNLLTQGAVCFELGGGVCDPKTGLPEKPTPIRKVTG